VAAAIARYRKDPSVLYVGPDYVRRLNSETIPNDTNFGSLWGMKNTGQSGGTIDADIDATDAWGLRRAASPSTWAVARPSLWSSARSAFSVTGVATYRGRR